MQPEQQSAEGAPVPDSANMARMGFVDAEGTFQVVIPLHRASATNALGFLVQAMDLVKDWHAERNRQRLALQQNGLGRQARAALAKVGGLIINGGGRS